MKTDFFYKKILNILGTASLVFVAFFSTKAVLLKDTGAKCQKTVYFIGQESDSVDVATYFQTISGGSGYVFDGIPVFSCCFDEKSAEKTSERIENGTAYRYELSCTPSSELDKEYCVCREIFLLADKAEQGEYTQNELRRHLSRLKTNCKSFEPFFDEIDENQIIYVGDLRKIGFEMAREIVLSADKTQKEKISK